MYFFGGGGGGIFTASLMENFAALFNENLVASGCPGSSIPDLVPGVYSSLFRYNHTDKKLLFSADFIEK